jgi:hypothetical protein
LADTDDVAVAAGALSKADKGKRNDNNNLHLILCRAILIDIHSSIVVAC